MNSDDHTPAGLAYRMETLTEDLDELKAEFTAAKKLVFWAAVSLFLTSFSALVGALTYIASNIIEKVGVI